MRDRPFNFWPERPASPHDYRAILRIGLPLVAGMFSTTLMEFTDRLFLSRYSVIAIAAALPAGTASMVLQFALSGLCGYVSTLIAQYAGAGRPERISCALWQGIWLSFAGALLLALSCLGAGTVFSWMGHGPEVAAEEEAYFCILNLGGVFFLLNSTLGGFFVGMGTTRPVPLVNFAGALLNIPLNYALIFGWGVFPELGIRGAALATVAGWSLSSLIFAVLILKSARRLDIPGNWKPDRDMFLRLLRFGAPSGVNLLVDILAFTWFIMEVGKLGLAELAASNIAVSINLLIFMPMLGLTAAVATLTGNAMGKGRAEDAFHIAGNAMRLSLSYMLPVAACCVLFGGALMDIFRTTDGGAAYAGIRETGIVLLYYVAAYSLVDSCNIVYMGALKGAGDTFAVLMILCFAALFCLILPIFLLKTLGLASLHSLWIVFTVYVVALALAARWRFLRGKWKNIRMI
ncbi:MAG: MATE family efflux transporter [Desulfovibrio sp.]|jgi:MATE family multidrug resistance protein|nr:MATE family efflux transporter [Desulfovibrio sp.]